MIIVVIGPHGAGKSSLCHALSKRLGIPYHVEIGEVLANSRQETAETALGQFDLDVLAEERRRDNAWAKSTKETKRSRIVESWHPGNMAYLSARNPDMVSSLSQLTLKFVDEASNLAGQHVLAIHISASEATLRARQHEEGSLGFFMTVGKLSEHWCTNLNIPVIARVCSDNQSPMELAEPIAQTLTTLMKEISLNKEVGAKDIEPSDAGYCTQGFLTFTYDEDR